MMSSDEEQHTTRNTHSNGAAMVNLNSTTDQIIASMIPAEEGIFGGNNTQPINMSHVKKNSMGASELPGNSRRQNQHN